MLQYWQEPPFVSFSKVLRTLLRSVLAHAELQGFQRAELKLQLAADGQARDLIGHVRAGQADEVQTVIGIAQRAILQRPSRDRGHPPASR